VVLVVKNASQLVQVASQGERQKRGASMRELSIIAGGALVAEDGRIVWVGRTEDLPPQPANAEVIDASGKTVLPGFVDSHTHLIFAGTREDEFAQRIRGTTYQEIAESGGGINATVRSVRLATKEELKNLARGRLDRMLNLGVTTVEAKSGYGLSPADEIKCLEAIAELNEEHFCDLVPTFLGAHEVPPEYRSDRAGYLRLVVNRMLPEVADRGLAAFCDVFCERGVFDVGEAETVLLAAARRGLGLKIHADEFSALGGAELAGKVGATSADHLLHITEAGAAAMRQAGTVATLLPGTAFFLGLASARARWLIDQGLAVALATDCNPGSCMTENLPLIGTMACSQMKMDPAEVITALTLNGAAALARSDRVGSLEVGKQADLAILDLPNYQLFPYHFGVNHVWRVVKSGQVVVRA
jgi:imidazolonepropionase